MSKFNISDIAHQLGIAEESRFKAPEFYSNDTDNLRKTIQMCLEEIQRLQELSDYENKSAQNSLNNLLHKSEECNTLTQERDDYREALEFYEGKVTRELKTEWEGARFLVFDKFGSLFEDMSCEAIAREVLAKWKGEK